MNGSAIRVVVADDEPTIRRGLSALLATGEGFEVVGEAADGVEAVTLCQRLAPDVVCMDVRMPRMDGIEATRVICELRLDTAVLVLTTFENDDDVRRALALGAQGFLLKRNVPASLAHAVRTVHQRDGLLFPDAMRRLVAQPPVSALAPHPDLTPREGEVLRLMARGRSNAEVAAELYVTVETVKTHVARILLKLGVRDRVQAVVRAYDSGFVAVDPETAARGADLGRDAARRSG